MPKEIVDLECERCFRAFIDDWAFLISCCGRSVCKLCVGSIALQTDACILCKTKLKVGITHLYPNKPLTSLLRLLTQQKEQQEKKKLDTEMMSQTEVKTAASCIHFLNEAGIPIENLADLVVQKQIKTA